MTIFLLALVLVALAFAGIAIKLLVKKNGEFAGTCSSRNPLLECEDGVCSICGAPSGQDCRMEEKLG